MASDPGWTLIWAMPNLAILHPIETGLAAMAGTDDPRVVREVERYPALGTFFGAFKNEFGVPLSPAVLMLRADAAESIRTVSAIASFRDAVCLSAIPLSLARLLTWSRSVGIQFSDAFDPYPWMMAKGSDGRILALTPALQGVHKVESLQARSAPATGERVLSAHDIDLPLLVAVLKRWDSLYAEGMDDVRDRRLFRALDMARAALRMPGGTDSTLFDQGRSVALWISAFEILAHDGSTNLSKVLRLFDSVPWQHDRLKNSDRAVWAGKTRFLTNLAGVIYKRLYDARNHFLHGEPVTNETLKMPEGRHVLYLAAPLFRLALAAYLGLRVEEHDLPEGTYDTPYMARLASRWSTQWRAQRLVEDAILLAETPYPVSR